MVSEEITHERGRSVIKISPWDKKELRLNVMIDYPGIGNDFSFFSFPDSSALQRVVSAYTQGWPPRLFYLSKAASMFGWPNHKKIIWPQEHEPRELLRLFSTHRAMDLLGALSIICEKGLLAADIVSTCSGHRDDLVVLPKIAEKLRPLS